MPAPACRCIAIVIAILAVRSAAGVRERVPMRGIAAGGRRLRSRSCSRSLGLRGKPTEATQVAVTEHSYVGPRMVPLLRKLDRSRSRRLLRVLRRARLRRHEHEHPARASPTFPATASTRTATAFDNQEDADAAHAAGRRPTPDRAATTLKGGENVLVDLRRHAALRSPRLHGLPARRQVADAAHRRVREAVGRVRARLLAGVEHAALRAVVLDLALPVAGEGRRR